jgi:hypothetical protein
MAAKSRLSDVVFAQFAIGIFSRHSRTKLTRDFTLYFCGTNFSHVVLMGTRS